jgi:RNA polymerase sigma-70 factor (ECF subfamily)
VKNRHGAVLAAEHNGIGRTEFHTGTDIDDGIDANLIGRITKKDQQAFESLYYRYHQRLARFIYRMGGRSEFLEEIINDTLYVVWCKAETFNAGAKPSTWIFGIAYNKTLKSLKAQYRQQPEFDSELMETLENTLIADVRSDTEKIELENWFACAFEELPPEQRATIELTFYHDMSYQEIAVLMQCSENTVKTRMFHARKKLQAILPRLAEAVPQSIRASEENRHEPLS